MTTDTRSVVEQFFSAFGAGDIPAVKDLFASDIDFVVHGGPDTPWAGRRSRRDELDDFFAAFGVLGPASEYEIQRILVDGEHAVVLGHNAFPVVATEKSFSNDFALHVTVRNGAIVGYQMYEDSYAIAQALAS